MNKKIWRYLAAAILVGVVLGIAGRAGSFIWLEIKSFGGDLFSSQRSISRPNGNEPIGTAMPNDNLSLITEPNDGIAPLLRMIRSASTSIDLVMYEMDDPQLEDDLVAAEKRGVAVRVLLNGGYYGVPDTGANAANVTNEPAYTFLNANDVSAKWTPAYFALTHQKSIVVDGNTAIIMTFNLLPEFYATGRDFGIVDRDSNDVAAIEAAFNDDWNGNQTTASHGDDLVWSPGSENAILSIINSAKTSLDIYNEEMADDDVTAALVAAAKRKVAVRIDMTNSSEWNSAFKKLSEAGVSIRTYAANAPLYIHAKIIIADGNAPSTTSNTSASPSSSAQAFAGSQNFSYTSLANNRELGIIFNNPEIIKSLETTFGTDWKKATPFN